MSDADTYHSAHFTPVTVGGPVDGFMTIGEHAGRLHAFTHDLMAAPDLPKAFADCDVLYAEPPWRKGFGEFNRRAGVDEAERSYRSFVQRVGAIIESATVPTYVLTGRHALPQYPKPDFAVPTTLFAWDAVIVGYRVGFEAFGDYPTSPEFIAALADSYGRVGDFCCGYGRTGRAFLQAGKSAVLSDLDPKCIGYIAERASSWLA